MGKKRSFSTELFSVLTMLALFVAVFIVVVFGASSYRGSLSSQDHNNELRKVLGYVNTAVKNEHTDNVAIEEIEGVKALNITNEITGLQRRIYFRDGSVYENYGTVGSGFIQDAEMKIADVELFEFRSVSGGIIEIETSYGTSYVHIGG
ncbi:MAG: DUF4860 domain-containing protein [Clostridia bacterium]|nr:DUF4860 domain-containing protein [Clostridia bacterium]